MEDKEKDIFCKNRQHSTHLIITLVGKNSINVWVNFNKHGKSTTIQKHKNLRGKLSPFKGKNHGTNSE